MRKSTAAGSSDPQRKNFVPCRCPGNPRVSLPTARRPLATIQEEAQKRNLAINAQKESHHQKEENLRLRTLSPIVASSSTRILSIAPEMATSSRSKSEEIENKGAQRAAPKTKCIPWAQSTVVTQKVQSTIPHIYPVIRSATVSISSGSNYSRASTVLEENKERSQVNLKRKLDIPSMGLKESSCRNAWGQRASIGYSKVPKYSESKTSTLEMRCDVKERQKTSERSQSKMSQVAADKPKLKPVIRADLTKSSSSSGYSSIESTKSSSTLNSAGQTLEIANLDSQNFYTLTQKTMSPSFSRSSTNPTKSSACSAVSESQAFQSPTWGALSLAAQKGKVAVIRDTSLICEKNVPFLPMEQFMQNLEDGNHQSIETVPVSPCGLNWIPRTSNVNFENNSISKPAMKSTLIRNKKQHKPPLMYTPDYDEAIIYYCFALRTHFLADKALVNAHMNKRSRTCAVEWILKVSNYVTPEIDSVFYMSIRLFDFAVLSLKLNSKLYQLAGIVAIWISVKYHVDLKLEIPKLYSFCESKFSKQEILLMEKKLLKAAHFCLSMADPLDFLNYYLKISNLDQDEVLRYGANFVLECSTMFELYSYTDPAFLIAASLYLAYIVIRPSNIININFIWYQKVDLETYANKVLKPGVLYAITRQLEPAKKYSSPKKLFVAKLFV